MSVEWKETEGGPAKPPPILAHLQELKKALERQLAADVKAREALEAKIQSKTGSKS